MGSAVVCRQEEGRRWGVGACDSCPKRGKHVVLYWQSQLTTRRTKKLWPRLGRVQGRCAVVWLRGWSRTALQQYNVFAPYRP